MMPLLALCFAETHAKIVPTVHLTAVTDRAHNCVLINVVDHKIWTLEIQTGHTDWPARWSGSLRFTQSLTIHEHTRWTGSLRFTQMDTVTSKNPKWIHKRTHGPNKPWINQ